MKIFLLRRLIGLANIADGLVTLFTPWRLGAGLAVAKKYAKAKGAK